MCSNLFFSRVFLSVTLPHRVVSCSAGCFATQTWNQEPVRTEVNPEGNVVLACKVYNKQGMCSWQKDGKVSTIRAGVAGGERQVFVRVTTSFVSFHSGVYVYYRPCTGRYSITYSCHEDSIMQTSSKLLIHTYATHLPLTASIPRDTHSIYTHISPRTSLIFTHVLFNPP